MHGFTVSTECVPKSQEVSTTQSTDYSIGRERRANVDLNQSPSAYQPNALPLGQTGSLDAHQNTINKASDIKMLMLPSKCNLSLVTKRELQTSLSV